MPQNKFILTRKQQDALVNFLEYTDVHRLSRNLRNMLLLFLEYEPDGIPSSMPDLPYDLQLLFQLLDEVG